MRLNNHIVYLIGFMGSGKTTAGRKLAALLGWSFVDLDNKIEEHTGMTIAQFFSQHGEAHFRDIESKLLKNNDYQVDTVVSTGGGTPCYSDNLDYMLDTGLTIYLRLTPEQLKSRLSGSADKRPLLKDMNEETLQTYIEEKLDYREKWYNRAGITVSGFNLDVNILYSTVKDNLNI